MTMGRIALACWILSVLCASAVFWYTKRRSRVSWRQGYDMPKEVQARKELARILADQSDEVLLRLDLSDALLEEIAAVKLSKVDREG